MRREHTWQILVTALTGSGKCDMFLFLREHNSVSIVVRVCELYMDSTLSVSSADTSAASSSASLSSISPPNSPSPGCPPPHSRSLPNFAPETGQPWRRHMEGKRKMLELIKKQKLDVHKYLRSGTYTVCSRPRPSSSGWSPHRRCLGPKHLAVLRLFHVLPASW
jgi:hypothetical protein